MLADPKRSSPKLADIRGQLSDEIASGLIDNRLAAQPELGPIYSGMSDEAARMHYGEEDVLDSEHLRKVTRFFHAWKSQTIRERAGKALDSAAILDVGDSDGLLLKELGKSGTGFNLSEPVVRNIRANGIEAVLGDAHDLPFDTGQFDFVFCFQTLEHTENPHNLLEELARACRPGGRVFLSIPWVPQTFIHARDFALPRGEEHVFEFSRTDFAALLTHTPLEIRWTSDCEILGPPRTTIQRAYVRATKRSHIVGSSFRAFQFYELAHREG
jgi:SAM-dependent methyltransferase